MSINSPWIHIIGAGVSGVMLGVHLAKNGRLPGQVVISESRANLRRSQSFGFWVKGPHALDSLIHSRWKTWNFSLKSGENAYQTGNEYEYAYIEGDLFFSWAQDILNNHPDISLNLNTHLARAPQATHVLDSRPPKLSTFVACQSFVGFEVEEPFQENPTARLMTDLQVMDQSLLFLYELPLSSGRTLIEWTAFGPKPFDLNQLDQLGLKTVDQRRILRREQGVIPMGVSDGLDHLGTPIGARAGMTRAASGYGFLRMWEWAEKAAKALIHTNQLPTEAIDPAWLNWMDHCMLRLVREAPHTLPNVFMQLGLRTEADDFAAFMMQPSLRSAGRIVLSAPKRPFIASALGLTRWI